MQRIVPVLKMKKTIIIISAILLVSIILIIANGVGNVDREIKLSKKCRDALIEAGIVNALINITDENGTVIGTETVEPKAIEYECHEDYKCFHLIGNNLNKYNWLKIELKDNMDDEDIMKKIDKEVEKDLKKICKAYLKRQEGQSNITIPTIVYNITEE